MNRDNLLFRLHSPFVPTGDQPAAIDELVANVEACGMVYPMVPAGGSVTNMILGDK